MISKEERQRVAEIQGQTDIVPDRLQDNDLELIYGVLESGREQKFLGAAPWNPTHVPHKALVETVKEMRWEGLVEIEKEDIDDDDIPDDVVETGWHTTELGMELLRRIKAAAKLDGSA